MKNLAFLCLTAVIAVAAPHCGTAQTKTAPKRASTTVIGGSSQLVMRNGEVAMRQGSRMVPLTKNVVLSNGTKVNYKSGIVEFPTGKKTTLHEGDYVTAGGEVVFATPASAAAARGDSTVRADARYTPYVEKTATPASTSVTAIATPNDLTSLLTRKVQLLTEKIRLMTPNPANQAALADIDRQLQTLDARIGR